MNTKGKLWSEKEDALLAARWSEQVRVENIAKEIGRTRSSVIGRAFRLGLPRRGKISEQERVYKLYNQGFRHSFIAEKLGITQNSSRVYLHNERIKRGEATTYSVGYHASRVVKQAEKAMKPRKLIPYAGAE